MSTLGTSAAPRELVMTSAGAAAATWIATVVVTALFAARVDLTELSDVVISASVVPAVAGALATAVVGFTSGRRDRRTQDQRCVAAAVGAFAYLALAAAVALLGGNLQVGAAALAGAVVGAVTGGAAATVLLQRSDQ